MKPLLIVSILLLLGTSSCKEQEVHSDQLTESPVIDNSMEKESAATLALANAFMGAMGKGDMEAMANLMHPDMVWHNEGDKSLPWIGPWSGKTTILETFMPLFGANFKTLKWETQDGFAHGNTAAFFGTMVGLTTQSNTQTQEFSFALRVKVKEGKIILWNWFEDSYQVSKSYHTK